MISLVGRTDGPCHLGPNGRWGRRQPAAALTPPPGTLPEIAAWSRTLETLQGRFCATAHDGLSSIRDPSEISVVKRVFTLQSTAEADLRKALAGALTDYKAMVFCSLLSEVAAAQTADVEGIRGIRTTRKDQVEQVRGLLVEKTAYLDFDLRDNVTENADYLQAVSITPPKMVQLEGDGGDTLLAQPIPESGG